VRHLDDGFAHVGARLILVAIAHQGLIDLDLGKPDLIEHLERRVAATAMIHRQ
jgi:hypothetical protein